MRWGTHLLTPVRHINSENEMIPDWAYTEQEKNGLFAYVQDFKLRTKTKNHKNIS